MNIIRICKTVLLSLAMFSPMVMADATISVFDLGEPIYLSVFGLSLLIFGGMKVNNQNG